MTSNTPSISDIQIDSFGGIFSGKRVLVTGHTGFKGSWLSEWLLGLGADIWGLSLPPPTSPSLFDQLGLSGRLRHTIGDIRDLKATKSLVAECQPHFVFHLAAQPLVRASYEMPVETYATNVMGTVHVLEALRGLKSPCAAVMVTTDKCYENREWNRGYREEDSLGGYDPYSSSKGAAEIAIAAYRRSFFPPDKLGRGSVPPVAIASGRAGNVIGGGDWALDRIVPDCMRALASSKPIGIRNPHATRPWQHVLEPLGGYLSTASQLWRLLESKDSTNAGRMHETASAFNFGPNPESNRTVGQLVSQVLEEWPGTWTDLSDPKAVHEAQLLSLSIEKAARVLSWHPHWSFKETVKETVGWYREMAGSKSNSKAGELTQRQIAEYSALLMVRNSESPKVDPK
jgi:CDP-glucose 4,6-dehydratase